MAACPICKRHILVVDDEPLVCETVTMLLRLDGHFVDTASSGAQALALFQPGKFDLVITDFFMPAMTGDKLAEAIKQLVPSMPVILITGFGDLLRAAEEGTTGADVVVGKPIRFGKFRETLASVL